MATHSSLEQSSSSSGLVDWLSFDHEFEKMTFSAHSRRPAHGLFKLAQDTLENVRKDRSARLTERDGGSFRMTDTLVRRALESTSPGDTDEIRSSDQPDIGAFLNLAYNDLAETVKIPGAVIQSQVHTLKTLTSRKFPSPRLAQEWAVSVLDSSPVLYWDHRQPSPTSFDLDSSPKLATLGLVGTLHDEGVVPRSSCQPVIVSVAHRRSPSPLSDDFWDSLPRIRSPDRYDDRNLLDEFR
ncbi:hypothetical protein JCM10212_000724 [Sporobolomyces blumeae]